MIVTYFWLKTIFTWQFNIVFLVDCILPSFDIFFFDQFTIIMQTIWISVYNFHIIKYPLLEFLIPFIINIMIIDFFIRALTVIIIVLHFWYKFLYHSPILLHFSYKCSFHYSSLFQLSFSSLCDLKKYFSFSITSWAVTN
jgi:hypothetical protein